MIYWLLPSNWQPIIRENRACLLVFTFYRRYSTIIVCIQFILKLSWKNNYFLEICILQIKNQPGMTVTRLVLYCNTNLYIIRIRVVHLAVFKKITLWQKYKCATNWPTNFFIFLREKNICVNKWNNPANYSGEHRLETLAWSNLKKNTTRVKVGGYPSYLHNPLGL